MMSNQTGRFSGDAYPSRPCMLLSLIAFPLDISQ
jgi:hypothetical protein